MSEMKEMNGASGIREPEEDALTVPDKLAFQQTVREKLTSRKFWAAVGAAAAAILCALMGDRLSSHTVEALRCGTGALIAYIFGEGAVDLSRILAEAFAGREE